MVLPCIDCVMSSTSMGLSLLLLVKLQLGWLDGSLCKVACYLNVVKIMLQRQVKF